MLLSIRSVNIATAAGDRDDNAAPPPPSSIPVIDIAPLLAPSSPAASRADVTRRIGSACRDVGFFAVVNHGVDPDVVQEAWGVARDFFDLPLEDKSAVRDEGSDYPYGYESSESLAVGKKAGVMGSECSADPNDRADGSAAAEAPPPPTDLKETFSIGPPDPEQSGMPARRFPPEPPGLAPALSAYYAEMEGLARTLLRAFAAALDLDEGWFDDKMDGHASALRAVNYPALAGEEARAGRIRAGAHTDYGALTILWSGGPGLQVARDAPADAEDEDDAAVRWVDAPDLRDAFIINLGDLMQRWTNDRWRSTLHRVVIPPNADSTGRDNRRQSMAFFVNINNDAVVTPLETCVDEEHPVKYESMQAGEYLMRKHLASMGVPFEE